MKSTLQQMIHMFYKEHKNKVNWQKVVSVMMAIVVFCTTYALILPAITMEQTYYCGYEEHQHTKECYSSNTQSTLICSTEQKTLHTHEGLCYDAAGNLICNLPVLIEHIHNDSCYTTTGHIHEAACRNENMELICTQEETPLETVLVCGKQEIQKHTHTTGCLSGDGAVACGKEEFAVHQHSQSCLFSTAEEVLACTVQEHVHNDSCQSDPNADVEAAADWEKTFEHVKLQKKWSKDLLAIAQTQIGYAESQNNYQVVENGMKKGYTRYGQWYGEPYTDWDIMFLSFCLRYAQIPEKEIPGAVQYEIWMKQIQKAELFESYETYQPKEGDILFFDLTKEEQYVQKAERPVSAGIVSKVETKVDAPAGEEQIAYYKIIAGNIEHKVSQIDVKEEFILGSIPIEELQIQYEESLKEDSSAEDNDNKEDMDSANGDESAKDEQDEEKEIVSVGQIKAPVFNIMTPLQTVIDEVEERIQEYGLVTAAAAPNYPHYPESVITGDVHIERLRFYNLCENGNTGVSALAGCVFEITGTNGYSHTIVSGDSIETHLPNGIPDGTYTIREVSAPAGYMRDTNYERTFQIRNGILVSDKNIGTFINHNMSGLDAIKTGEVEDYNNRIYEILLSAESHMRTYQMGPVDVLFVVDQSNSMLFPAGLNPIGKSVRLNVNGNNNVQNLERLNLDKNQMYYVISDPKGTSTVWSIWHNGRDWIYQDASYYAKAKQSNAPGYQDPNEKVIFPENRSYADQKNAEGSGVRSNGGGIGFSLSGSSLGKYLDTFGNGTTDFQIYTATSEYNRLHYLEEALANMIYELADINTENRVTLTKFTKTVDTAHGDCMGPLKLTPDNTKSLVDAVTNIHTSGGTRQDIALKHIYEKHLNDASQGYTGNLEYTYTILITDGAPVLSSGSDLSELGTQHDQANTQGSTVYSQIKGWGYQVRGKSTLMTVSLGMDDVEAGKAVLQDIASSSKDYCALDDAAQLVKSIQELLFDSFKPKDIIPVYGDIIDEISDSFYPIAWMPAGAGAGTGRRVLVTSNDKDWILLEQGDWITADGKYTTAGAKDADGQLRRKDDGTFYVIWENKKLYTSNDGPDIDRVGWVWAGNGANTGRQVLATYDNRDWILLNENDAIDSQGQYLSNPGWYGIGRVRRNNTGDYYIDWGWGANASQRLMYVPPAERWSGTVFVKAKEDFIGGNAIETNKDAKIVVDESAFHLASPTVNVRLLDMNQMSSEVTVYLGGIVNEEGHAPIDALKGFFEDTTVFKLIEGDGDVLNKVAEADGLEEAVFYLKYALGRELTEEEWAALANGESVLVPYTYDNDSSNGPVGSFTFRLEKIGAAGAVTDYEEHEATAACQPNGQPLSKDCNHPAETYTLHITYNAYRLGQNGRPGNNVHNGSGSPGTEVGRGTTLPTGLGVVQKENIHEVHVISGAIEITKKFKAGISSEEPQEFSFVLHREEDGEDTSKDVVKSITIPANQSQGRTKIRFENLRQGTYTVTEAENMNYQVETIQVLDTTNCYSEPEIGADAGELIFVMGKNIENKDVIDRTDESEAYTSYIDPFNGVFGAAEFTNEPREYTAKIPVQKAWSDGAAGHDKHAVYVVLYEDGKVWLDAQGYARILKLDTANGWNGRFVVPLVDKNDKLSNYNYSIREVSQISQDSLYQWQAAILENDGETVVYYERALEAGDVIGIDTKAYIVQYEEHEDASWTVTNLRGVELPETGGMGTRTYTISGLLLIIAGLMYGCILKRRWERRGSK